MSLSRVKDPAELVCAADRMVLAQGLKRCLVRLMYSDDEVDRSVAAEVLDLLKHNVDRNQRDRGGRRWE